MAGIYIHIPFCRQACHYCNFHFSTTLQRKDEMIDAIIKEIVLQKSYLHDDTIETIYFGGGTPSLLDAKQVAAIINAIKENYLVNLDNEITLEANPDDITADKLQDWKAAGINRLSIGVQSFFEEDLKWMNRAHNATQAKNCIELAQQYGFNNITIDLIYGTPSLTDEKWKINVDTAIAYNIPHLSCYALTVEPKTALQHMIEKKQLKDVDAGQQSTQFLQLMQWMETAGYDHYEISNFGKPGMHSRHNTSYWQGKKYLGIGPSAHSFNGKSRQWNIANNALYITGIEQQKVPYEIEWLTEAQQLNEYIMTALRTSEGININWVKTNFGDKKMENILTVAKKYIDADKMFVDTKNLLLTKQGKLYADGIAADLFLL